MHLLRPESITPIGLYLERRRQAPDSFAVQLEFATVLLYREREYRAMYQARWFSGAIPAPAADSPFAPFDLTEPAAAILRSAIAGTVGGPDDLFGLKSEAAAGLSAVLRRKPVHRIGWLVYARLLVDLCRVAEATDAAEQAITLGEGLSGLAIVNQAAVLEVDGPDALAKAEAAINTVDRRARRILAARPIRRNWMTETLNALEERVRQRAIRTRSRVEGSAFTRYIMTELAFCEQERTTALAAFEPSRVPRELRHLVPLARAIGVGDDPCRGLFIRKIPARERRAAARQIRDSAGAIDAWLATVGGPPFEGEAAAFFWLLEAAEEMESA